jgi:hypothetical protein
LTRAADLATLRGMGKKAPSKVKESAAPYPDVGHVLDPAKSAPVAAVSDRRLEFGHFLLDSRPGMT